MIKDDNGDDDDGDDDNNNNVIIIIITEATYNAQIINIAEYLNTNTKKTNL
jgi:hypothetical protein